MSKLTEEQMKAIYGKAATNAPYNPGDTISFRDARTGVIKTGELLYAVAPRISSGTGTIHSTQYFVDCGDGFPDCVLASDIVANRKGED